MSLCRALLLLVIWVILPINMFAWGKQGHKIIALIAKSQVQKAVVAEVDRYLKGMTWEEASVWMDDMKSAVSSEYMRDWHYANAPKDKTYVKSRTPDVVSQLEYHLKILRNRSLFTVDAIHEALKVVFHLVGDICQPLHCGYAEDRGGNLVPVKFKGRETNLHKLWDSELIEELKTDIWTCSKTMLYLDETEKKEIQNIDPKTWFNDSRKNLVSVYNLNGGSIDEQYVIQNQEVVQKQLVKAGLRLASVLDTHFKVASN